MCIEWKRIIKNGYRVALVMVGNTTMYRPQKKPWFFPMWFYFDKGRVVEFDRERDALEFLHEYIITDNVNKPYAYIYPSIYQGGAKGESVQGGTSK